jgi:hypothetical protein
MRFCFIVDKNMPNKWYGEANYKQTLKYTSMFGLLAFCLVVSVMLADSYKIKQGSNNMLSEVTSRLKFQVTDIIILSFHCVKNMCREG